MAYAKHITVGSTTYDIAPADGPTTGVKQWNSPNKTGNQYISFAGRNNNYCYFKVNTTFYRTADFQTFTTITVPNTSVSYFYCSEDGTIMCCYYSTNFYISRNSGSSYTTITLSSACTGCAIANSQILISQGNSTQNSYIYYITSSNTAYNTNQQGCIQSSKGMCYYNTHYYFQAIIGSSDWYLVASKNATLQASYPFMSTQTQPSGIALYGSTPICWYLTNDQWSLYQINMTTSAISTTQLATWATMRIMPASAASSYYANGKIVIYASYNPSSYQSQLMYSAIIDLSNYQIIIGTGAVGYYNGTGPGFYFKNKFYFLLSYPSQAPLWSIDLNTANIINGIV